MGSGVPVGTHPNFKNMGYGGFRVPGKLGRSGFRPNFFLPTPGLVPVLFVAPNMNF